jgi:hypothetical protein
VIEWKFFVDLFIGTLDVFVCVRIFFKIGIFDFYMSENSYFLIICYQHFTIIILTNK